MKVETQVALSEDLVEAIDGLIINHQGRSEFIETALWAFVKQRDRDKRAQQDLKILNDNADRINEEAIDVLDYQVSW